MGFDLDVTVPAITVFVQGILSFLSPCILPIIPLYMGYLSGGTISQNEDGSKNFSQKRVMINTLFFIIGVSFAFFLLGLGFSAAGRFFTEYQMIFARIGGIIVVLLGLVQLGVFDKPFKGREYKLPIQINALNMNPITALIMGFVFSFAWTPCVGPALSTVLIMISSASSMTTGILLMGIYTLGFTIPFLLVGIFTTQCLNFFKKHASVVAYTVKVGGLLMILMGLMMFTGIMNNITGYLSTLDGVIPNAETLQEDPVEDNVSTPIQEDSMGDNSPNTVENDSEQDNEPSTENQAESSTENENNQSEESIDEDNSETSNDSSQEDSSEENSAATDPDAIPAIEFELKDQFGNTHKMSDYKGKVVFLNFWATWCPPCREEMPDIQKLYENYGLNEEDVIILGVASPSSEENSYTQEQDEEGVIAFLEENNYTYPTVLDSSGRLEREYGISAYPTTFMIDVNGNIFGYLPGMMSYDIMESIIKQTQGEI